jgi:hypothetical protein
MKRYKVVTRLPEVAAWVSQTNTSPIVTRLHSYLNHTTTSYPICVCHASVTQERWSVTKASRKCYRLDHSYISLCFYSNGTPSFFTFHALYLNAYTIVSICVRNTYTHFKPYWWFNLRLELPSDLSRSPHQVRQHWRLPVQYPGANILMQINTKSTCT